MNKPPRADGDPFLVALEAAGALILRYRTTPSLHVDYISPRIQELTGETAEGIQHDANRFLAVVHPHDMGIVDASLHDSRTEPLLGTVRLQRPDGTVVWIEGHRVKLGADENGNAEYLIVCYDVSGRIRDNVHHRLALNATALRALSERLEEMLERERTRIARELHDELGQLLTGAKLDFAASIRRLRDLRTPRDVVDRLQAAIGQIDIGIAMVRRIATDLRPPGLDYRDLGAAIEYEAQKVSAKAGLPITVCNRIQLWVEPKAATIAFRIFQEALTNAVRHANATAIRTTVATTLSQRLVLYVSDNGRGIPASTLSSNASIGLLGMRERAASVGGTLRITGRGGRGTRVLFAVRLRHS